MMRTSTICLLLFTTTMASCGISESKYNQLAEENENLRIELDELKNGEPRLIAIINQSFEKRDYSKTKSAIEKLRSKHPASEFLPQADRIASEIASIEKATELAAQKAEAERERLANLNNTGIWQVSHYVDEFGEPTSQKLIRNADLIRGYFSNSATEDSRLTVRILIDSEKAVDFVLYEYAGNNPVKAYSPDKYVVQMLKKNGDRERLIATNYSDRLSFGPEHSGKIYQAFLGGGEVKFHIYEQDTPTTKYDFAIPSADYFENAVRLFKENIE